MGQLYQRGHIWWIKYYVNGRPVRESTGLDKEKAAARILKDREGRVATGQPFLPRADRVRYEEAVKDLRQHYETTGERNLEEVGGGASITWTLSSPAAGSRASARQRPQPTSPSARARRPPTARSTASSPS
jgi:hypothetical protein